MTEVIDHRAPDKLRLLFVHEVNWRKKPVYEMHDFPELLSLRGHECVFIDYPEQDEKHGLARLLDFRTQVKRDLHRAHAGARVEVRTPGRVLPPPLDRFAASTTQVPALWRALAHETFHAIILYAVPTNGWQTIMIARHFGVPVLFRALDVSHQLRKTHLAPLIHTAEKYVYANANAVSANNEALRRYCIDNGAHPNTTSVEYPGLDLDRFSPGAKSPELCRRYGIESHHRVAMFMGTLYRFAGLDWFLENFAAELKRRPDLKVLLVGGGEEEANLRAQAQRLAVNESVIVTGFVDYPQLADHLRLGDVGFCPFQKSVVTDCALPSKVIQYLGTGVPTVCTPLDGLRAMLPDEQSGVAYANLDDMFIRTVIELLTDDERRRLMSKTGRQKIETLCNWDDCTIRFEAAIRRVMRSPKEQLR